MLDHFSNVLLFPQSFIFTVLVFGIIGIILLFIVLLHAFSKQEKIMSRPALWDGFIKRIFFMMNKFVLVPYNSHSRVLFEFFQALKQSKVNSSKYDLPFCLLVGNDDLTINIAKNIDNTFGLGSFISDDENYVVYGYQKGVIIRCSETVVENKDYKAFIELLTNHKSAIPLDSINIVFSVKEILNQNHEQDFTLAKKWSTFIADVNKITQTMMSINVFVADLENLPGFDTFCSYLTEEQKNGLFGWSRAAIIMDVNVEEVYNVLIDKIRLIEQILCIKSRAKSVSQDLIAFCNTYQIMIEKMIKIIKQMSVFLEKMPLNGFYNIGVSKEIMLFDNAVWNKKIFLEQGIVESLNKYGLYANYSLRILQILVIFSGFVGGYLLIQNQKTLSKDYKQMKPRWRQLEGMISKQENNIASYEETEAINFFIQYTRILNNDLCLYKTIPTSYLSDVWENMEECLVSACQFVILDKLAIKLDKKITDLEKKVNNTPKDLILGDNIQDSKAYKNFAYLVDKLSLYIILSNKMMTLQYQNSLDDLDFLLRKLYNVSFGKMFLESEIYFKTLRRSRMKTINWAKYEKSLKKLLKEKFDILLDKKLNDKYIINKVETLDQNLKNINKNDMNLYEVKYSLTSILDWIDSEVSDIFNGDSIRANNDWYEILQQLELIGTVLGASLINDIVDKLEIAFKNMKANLLSIKFHSVGYMIEQTSEGKIKASKELLELLGLMNTLVLEQIMNEKNVKQKNNVVVENDDKKINLLLKNKKKNLINNQVKKASLIERANNKEHYFNFDVNILANIVKKIEHFSVLVKEDRNNTRNNIFNNALNILSDEIEDLLILQNKEKIDHMMSNKNDENILAGSGYIAKILLFAKNNNQTLYGLLMDSLLQICIYKTKEKYEMIKTSDAFELDINILAGGYDAIMLQKFYSNQAKKLENLMQNVVKWVEIYKLIKKMSNNKDDINSYSDEQMDTLEYIIKSLQDYKNTSGDLIALQSSVIKVFVDPDTIVAAEKEKWNGGIGFFANKFVHAMQKAKDLINLKRKNMFVEEYNALSTFFNNKCFNKFPFNLNANDNVGFDEIIELYKMIDQLLKKFDMNWMNEHANQKSEIKNVLDLLDMRNVLEGYVKGDSDLQININMRADVNNDSNVDKISQIILEVDNYKIDFRSKKLSIPFKDYEKIELTICLPEDSEYSFENDQKKIEIKIDEQWGLWKFRNKFKKGECLMIKMPIKKQDGSKEMLKYHLNFSILSKKTEILWKKLPNKL